MPARLERLGKYFLQIFDIKIYRKIRLNFLYFYSDFRSFAAEEALEQMEAQLEEANEVAKMSNQKFEDAGRKLKVI